MRSVHGGAAPSSAAAGEYTCPMHPEVVRADPGSGPICGMALEPRLGAAAEEESPELRDMARRLVIGALLTAPVVALGMSEEVAHVPYRAWIELSLSAPVVLWAGGPFFVRAWESVVARRPNMFTLIGLGTGAAFGHSVAATVAP